MPLAISGIAAKLGLVPKWVWYVIGAGLLVLAFVFWHRGQVKDHRKQVESELTEKINKESAKLIAQANKLKQDAIKLQGLANSQTETNYANTARDIAGRADALRLQRPPRCPTTPGNRNLPAISGRATEPAPASGAGDDTLAAIPWGPLIDFAEQHDLCRAKLIGWQDWYREQGRVYQEWLSRSPQ
jgi:hypothetical protein